MDGTGLWTPLGAALSQWPVKSARLQGTETPLERQRPNMFGHLCSCQSGAGAGLHGANKGASSAFLFQHPQGRQPPLCSQVGPQLEAQEEGEGSTVALEDGFKIQP